MANKMKKFISLYNDIINESYNDESLSKLDRYGLGNIVPWIKVLQENGFKELANNKFVYEKQAKTIILNVTLDDTITIKIVSLTGEEFYKKEQISSESDPAQTINMIINECSEMLESRVAEIKSLQI